MTDEQVLSFLRSRATYSPKILLEFALVRRLQPAPAGAEVAQQALHEAEINRFDLFREGILVDMMRSGGFIVLEFDLKTKTALKLDLVSVDGSGKPTVQSSELLESTNEGEALQVLERAEALSDPFFGPPGTAWSLREIAVGYGEKGKPIFGAPEGPMCQLAPDALVSLAKPEELSDLTAHACVLFLWPLRHSLAFPVYSASPGKAFMMAGDQLNKLVAQFPPAHGNEANYVNELLDLSTIDTPADLTARIQSLKALDDFLDQRSPLDYDAPTFKANAFISHIPLEFGTDHEVEGIAGRSYGVMAAPGLMTLWSLTGSGTFALRIIAETEY